MSWHALIAIIQDEADRETFERIEQRLRQELAALVVYVPSTRRLSRQDAHDAVRRHRGNVVKAAIDLGVHKATLYRRLVR